MLNSDIFISLYSLQNLATEVKKQQQQQQKKTNYWVKLFINGVMLFSREEIESGLSYFAMRNRMYPLPSLLAYRRSLNPRASCPALRTITNVLAAGGREAREGLKEETLQVFQPTDTFLKLRVCG